MTEFFAAIGKMLILLFALFLFLVLASKATSKRDE